jgi:hypothetical protein
MMYFSGEIMKRKITFLIFAITVCFLLSGAEIKKDFFSLAKKSFAAPKLIKESDVLFSTRWKHPVNKDDPYESFQAAKNFHATGFYWVYTKDPVWIKEIKNRGYIFQGSVNTILTDGLKSTKKDEGRILNQNGEKVAAPWMVSWNGYWGCANSPEYRKTFLEHAKIYIDAGADLLQMDDPKINLAAINWGGCYCKYCVEKAKILGKSPKEIQKESVADFYNHIIPELDKYAGKHIPFSCNNYSGSFEFPFEFFDFGIAELHERSAKPAYIFETIEKARAFGKKQIFTFTSSDKDFNRKVFSITHASGGHLIVPWDVYIDSKTPRYFGKPEEYSDLTGFVRASAAYLDGYENAFYYFKDKKDTRYLSSPPVLVQDKNADLSVFVKVKPDAPDSPIVIHLLDLRDKPENFSIKLDKEYFYGGKNLKASLITPVSYNKELHEKAEETKDYSALIKESVLSYDPEKEIAVPALSPWGILVIERH